LENGECAFFILISGGVLSGDLLYQKHQIPEKRTYCIIKRAEIKTYIDKYKKEQ
jgi:urease accessory protein UreH